MTESYTAKELVRAARELIGEDGLSDDEIVTLLEKFMDEDGVEAVDDSHDGIYNTMSESYKEAEFSVSGVIEISYPHTSGYTVPGGSEAEKAYEKLVDSNYRYLYDHLKKRYPDEFGHLSEITYDEAEDAGLVHEYEEAESELFSDDVIVVNLIGTYSDRKESIELYASVQIGDATRAAWAESVNIDVSKVKDARELKKLLSSNLAKLSAKF